MTSVALRPTARVSAAGLTDNSATMWQKLDDDPPVDSAGSFVEASGSAKAEAVLEMSTVTIPAGALIKSVQVGLRGRAASSTPGLGKAELRKADGTVLVSLADSAFRSAFRTAQSAEVRAETLTQADIDGLRVWFRTNAKQYGPWPVKVSEVYAWVRYVLQPTVTIDATVTAFTSSTIPVRWDFDSPDTDDGGSQSHYRVVLLTAAQYAAMVGGDPLSITVPVFDSGQVASPEPTLTMTGIPALTGAHLMVRAAHLVNGDPFWSAWADLTISNTLTIAAVDDVTVTAVGSAGRVDVVVARDTGQDPWTRVEVERARWQGGLLDEDGIPLFDENGQPLLADGDADYLVTWRAVAGTPTPTSGDTVTVADYGPNPNSDYVWRARARNAAGADGPWVYSVASQWAYATGRLWFKSAETPAMALAVWVVTEPLAETRPRRQVIHDIVPADGALLARRVASLWPLTGRESSLDCWTETAEEAAALESIVATGAVLMHPPADWRFRPGRFAASGLTEVTGDNVGTGFSYRHWQIDLVEIDGDDA